jgi:tetratricopeptide (TPR) repeat protein
MTLLVRRAVNCLGFREVWRKSKAGFLLAAAVTFVVLNATAQVDKDLMRMWERGPVGRPQAQQSLSANELRAPHAAREALQRAQQALVRGRDVEAGKDVERALQTYPNYAQALVFRGVMKMRSNRMPEACADFQQAIQFDPNLGAAYVALGGIYNSFGQFSEAVPLLSRATAILPTAWIAQYESALAHLGAGKIEIAWDAISRALDNLPDEPSDRSATFYLKARVLLELKNDQEGRSALAQSIHADPTSEFAKLARQLLHRLNAQQDQQKAQSVPQ